MLVRKGKNRIAVVFPSLGLAVKFPLVHVVQALRQLAAYGFTNPFPNDPTKSLAALLVKGLGDNWREFMFYVQTRHPFCQPTYFSLFGLFNIQRATHPCGLSTEALWSEIDDVTHGAAFADAHHFSKPPNFCHHDKRLMILDYGHPKTQEIIRQYGNELWHCEHDPCVHE